MSLIPYYPIEGREIVLRHRNAIVTRDTLSQRLEVRNLTECPTCHQPLNHPSTPDEARGRQYGKENEADSYVNPEYFRMLQSRNHNHTADSNQVPPSSPVRGLVQHAPFSPARVTAERTTSQDPDVEFLSSAPGVAKDEGSKIRRDAFSQDYFRTFFTEDGILGRGGKGVVMLVKHHIDGVALGKFACKRVPVGDDHGWLEKVLVEVTLLASLSHPNLVSYRHVWLEDAQLHRFGPPVVCVFILQQYCNSGDLHKYVLGDQPPQPTTEDLKAQMRRRSRGQADKPHINLTKPHLSFEEIYSLFKDITSGVAYLHSTNFIHRDLKPSNCLLHRDVDDLKCLISDFGEVQPENIVRKSTGSTGTISYCAPEVLKMDPSGCYGNFTTKSDMFSLGMILYFMCFGRLPYKGANALQEELEDIDELRDEIVNWKGFQTERRERPDLPAKLYVLLKGLLAVSPSDRPSATDVLSAMRNESNIETLSRPDRGQTQLKSLNSLNSHRIQSLDSPAQPGTPIPDDAVPYRRGRRPVTGIRRPSSQSPVKNHNLAGVTSPDGQEVRDWQSSGTSKARTQSRSNQDYYELHNNRSGTAGYPKTPRRPQSLRLLTDAPSSGTSLVRRTWGAVLSCMVRISNPDHGGVIFVARLAFFAGKITTLARPCWPYMSSLGVSIPLLSIAAIDLGLPSSLYDRKRVRSQQRDYAANRPSSVWGLWTSFFLLLLHFLILWIVRRRGLLCALHQNPRWSSWELG